MNPMLYKYGKTVFVAMLLFIGMLLFFLILQQYRIADLEIKVKELDNYQTYNSGVLFIKRS
jgi:hypothetical protein